MEAKKIKSIYKTAEEWRKADKGAYKYAERHGHLPKICEEVGWELPIINEKYHKKFPDGHWLIKENCIAVALTCKTKTEFQDKFKGAYKSARENQWMPDCTKHMKKILNKKWTKKRCIAMALTCKSKADWKKKSSGSHYAANKLGCFEECTKHMKKHGSQKN